MNDVEREIAATKALIGKLDPKLAPLLEPLLLQRLACLMEGKDRESSPNIGAD